jgi:hypothetical protein
MYIALVIWNDGELGTMLIKADDKAAAAKKMVDKGCYVVTLQEVDFFDGEACITSILSLLDVHRRNL